MRAASIPLKLPEQDLRRAMALCRAHGATLFAFGLAAFALLLHTLTGATDIPVAVPVVDRGRVELEDVIGLLTNIMIVRCDLAGNPTFTDLVARIFDATVRLHEPPALDYGTLVKALRADLGLAHKRLHQFLFNFHNVPGRDFAMGGLGAEEFPFPRRPATDADLYLNLNQAAGGLEGRFNYHPALFSRDRMLGLAARYRDLVHQAADSPGLRVSELGHR